MTTKTTDMIESVSGNADLKPKIIQEPTDKKDKKDWLIRTEDLQLCGPFSYKELYALAKNKRISRRDVVAKSCNPFETIPLIQELIQLLEFLPEEPNYEENTEKTIDREFTEVTQKSKAQSSMVFFKNLFNFSIIPLNTFLWVLLFILVVAYLYYYISSFNL